MTIDEIKETLKADIRRLKKEEENARDEYHAEWYNGQWRGIQHALEIIGMLGKPNNHGKRKEV